LAAAAISKVVPPLQVTVFCKYVRRELRGLADEDKEAFFDAAYTLWSVR